MRWSFLWKCGIQISFSFWELSQSNRHSCWSPSIFPGSVNPPWLSTFQAQQNQSDRSFFLFRTMSLMTFFETVGFLCCGSPWHFLNTADCCDGAFADCLFCIPGWSSYSSEGKGSLAYNNNCQLCSGYCKVLFAWLVLLTRFSSVLFFHWLVVVKVGLISWNENVGRRGCFALASSKVSQSAVILVLFCVTHQMWNASGAWLTCTMGLIWLSIEIWSLGKIRYQLKFHICH